MADMEYPSELELLEFFEVEPSIHDDVYLYEVEDPSGKRLVFSFNPMDDSVQTTVKFQSTSDEVCFESARRIWIEGDWLLATFDVKEFCIQMKLKHKPLIEVRWSGLKDY